MRKYIFVIFGMLFCVFTFAESNYYYCGKTMSYVHIGDTLDQVIATCGSPATTKSQHMNNPKTREVMRWVYNRQPNSGGQGQQIIFKKNALVVDFFNDKAVKILVHGESVSTLGDFCGPFESFKLGDPPTILYQICRYPDLKENIQEPISSKPISETILTYKEDEISPPVQLSFQNDQLTRIDQ